ncbi:hypothetical protein [Halobaculum rarum]|uniref:hypothetical protein n=1 Tax=Halobaculum rarum TaxID=3075122 RepID=UPI0032AF6620
MRQPTQLGHGVPEPDASIGPAVAVVAVVLAALLASLFPLVAAAAGGATVALAARRLLPVAREQFVGRQRRVCLPGTRACVAV